MLGRCRVWAEAALTTPGLAGTARRPGSGKRNGKVYVRNQRVKLLKTRHQLKSGGYGLGRGARPRCEMARGNSSIGLVSAGREATVNVCGVAVARPQGQSWAPNPTIDRVVNVGTGPRPPLISAIQAGVGQAHRRLTVADRGGVAVVVGGRESRSQGEGRQRVRGGETGMRRWVVERTLAWITRCRRTVRDYERRPEHHAAIVQWSMIIIMTRRLARHHRTRTSFRTGSKVVCSTNAIGAHAHRHSRVSRGSGPHQVPQTAPGRRFGRRTR